MAYLLTAKLPDVKAYDMTSLKRWAYGGAPMLPEQIHAVRPIFGDKMVCVYGLTEAGPNGTLFTLEEQVEHAGSVGRRATVNTEVRVGRPDGTDAEPGEMGEMILRTASAMDGYWQNEQATRETLRDGWFLPATWPGSRCPGSSGPSRPCPGTPTARS